MACFGARRGGKERAWFTSYTRTSESDASRPERSCGTLGRNKRPCEKQDKAAAAYPIDKAGKVCKISLNNLILK